MYMADSSRKKIAIIDGKSVFYRGYYAMSHLATKDGVPTGGVYGFAVMALEVLKKLDPDYVCVAWDKCKTNVRKRRAIYPEYKAGRKTPPEDFFEQIPVLHELLEAFGWPLYELDDYEADDLMGTLAVQATEQGYETMLITSDLDALQLLDKHVHVYALKKGLSNIERFDKAAFREKYGLEPEQFLNLKALMGDSSDNIPGVAGIGQKTATELLKKHKTLDGVYENIELISGATKKKLAQGKDKAYMSKRLAAMWLDAPLKLDVAQMNGDATDFSKIAELFQRLEFRALVRQLPESMTNGQEMPQSLSSIVPLKVEKIVQVDDDKTLKTLPIEDKIMVLQSRSAGAHGRKPKWLALSVIGHTTTWLVQLDSISPETLAEAIARSSAVMGYDTKSSLKVLYELGIPLPRVEHDVFLAAFLLNPLRREQSLHELAEADLRYDGSSLDELSDEEYPERVGDIIASVKQLHSQQIEQLDDLPALASLAQKIEWPVIPVLARMEHIGIKLDTVYLKAISEELRHDISDVEQEIYGHADREFNVSSPQQLAEVLFEDLKLPTVAIKKGKTGYSTAANELGKLRDQHPIIEAILHYREYTKLKSTYVDALPELVDEHSRLHTTFHQTITQTGRLSSTDPNLQNIPVRTALGRRIRQAFVADEGNVLVSADYSQFELRLAAHLSGDQEMIQLFNDGADIHTITAAQIYGREPEDVTKTMRRDAKVINFGILYGMSPHGLVAATGMTYAAAKQFIETYFQLRKPLLAYIDSLKQQAKEQGYVETLFGRRRPTPDIKSNNFIVRKSAERAAINMPIQGTEADIMKLAMAAVDEKLPSGAVQLLQIHDSILVECRTDDAQSVAATMKSTMESIYELSVRLDVDTAIGGHWGEL